MQAHESDERDPSAMQPAHSGTDAPPSADDGSKTKAELRQERVARLLRTLALLACEGASVAVYVKGFRAKWLRPFVHDNELDKADRNRLILWILAAAFLSCATAIAYLLVERRKRGVSGFDLGLARVHAISNLLAPAVILWSLPQMSTTRGWFGRDLAFLISASLLVLAFEPSLRLCLQAGVDLGLLDRAKRAGTRMSRAGDYARRFVPPVAVAIASAAYISYMSWYTLLQHWRRETSGFDLGYFSTFFWNTIHGRPFYCPITHPRDGSYLSIHAEFAVYLFAPIYALWPRAETLLILQSALLGLAAVPLYLFARKMLHRDWLAAAIALCFLFYVPLEAPNFCDFHFLTLSLFFVLWAAYFFVSGRHVLFWAAVVAALLCREDVPFGGIAVGMALLFSGRHIRTGAALAALSACYLAVVKFFIMPKFGEPSFVYIYEHLVAPGEEGFKGVLKTLMTNPLYTLSQIILPAKLPYVLQIFMPLAFLPLRRIRLWFLLFPGFFVTLLSTGYAPVIEIRYQYVTHFTPYVFIAAVLALKLIDETKGAIACYAAAGAVILGTYFAQHQYGVLQHDNFYSGVGKVSFDFTDVHKERLRNLREIATTIPKNASLAATELDCAHLAQREYLFTLRFDPSDAEYMLYSDDSLDVGNARRLVRDALTSGRYGFHAERPNFVVLRRGAATDRNAELLERLGNAKKR